MAGSNDEGAPTRFGPYTIRNQLGSGGMATVHVATLDGPGGFEKLVCIKRIRTDVPGSDRWLDSFVTEAKLAAQIRHPNVVEVNDLGVVDGVYYIAMEYVAGVDVLSILRRAGDRGVMLPYLAATYVVHEVCCGLDAAHRQADLSGRPLGIVHRDVSPQNVLVSYEGQVKLTDFGIAKSHIASMMTAPGEIKGKANYMSPEQARGAQVDARTDIFAAGIVLFELLTGEPFYPPSSIDKAIKMALKPKLRPLAEWRSDVPPELEEVVRTALAPDPIDRYGTAQWMADALNHVLLTRGPTYGANQLLSLVEWLYDDDEPEELAGSETETDLAKTRVANAEDIRQRRSRRDAGRVVRPVPAGLVEADKSRPGFRTRIARFAKRFIDGDTAPERR
ncbi:MAG: serine/threonine protein kinase [Sandaracinaceae bacterium]|nr:serine/threonine protein kinase [Sandaracinaceae bacterium]